MKRSWIGLALLLVLLALGICVTWAMDRIHGPVAEGLRQAQADAALGDWDDARRELAAARESWDKWEHFRDCFSDHSPVEEIAAGLEALWVCCEEQEKVAFRASCLELATQVEAVGDAHGLFWWNLL